MSEFKHTMIIAGIILFELALGAVFRESVWVNWVQIFSGITFWFMFFRKGDKQN